MRLKRILLALLVGAASPARGQETVPPLDGRQRLMQDSLLDHLAGDWRVERIMRGRTTENAVRAEWVLNHQFLLLHIRARSAGCTRSHFPSRMKWCSRNTPSS